MNKIQEEHGYLMIRSDFISQPKNHEEVTIKHMGEFLEYCNKNYHWSTIDKCYWKLSDFYKRINYTTNELIQEYIKQL